MEEANEEEEAGHEVNELAGIADKLLKYSRARETIQEVCSSWCWVIAALILRCLTMATVMRDSVTNVATPTSTALDQSRTMRAPDLSLRARGVSPRSFLAPWFRIGFPTVITVLVHVELQYHGW